MTQIEKFFAQFKFDPARTGLVGVEREQFTADYARNIVPASGRYLEAITALDGRVDKDRLQFGYELSACQLESKIGPSEIADLRRWLNVSEAILRSIDGQLRLTRIHAELAPENMPLDIYPDPTGRYQRITADMPKMVLTAACRVAATHIHIGMPNLETAISSYNKVISHTDELIRMGDHSSGKRMDLYRVMAPRYRPETIHSPRELFERSVAHGFVSDPRQCWTVIRISVHGTVEFRMFGATDSAERIVEWAGYCRKLCF